MIYMRKAFEENAGTVWIQAPFKTSIIKGMAVTAPAGKVQKPEITIYSESLAFRLGETRIVLSDAVKSGWVYGCDGNATIEVQKGEFPIFTSKSKIEQICEEESVSVVRVSTPLEDRCSKEPLGDAWVHTDLYFWHAVTMVSVVTCFEAEKYTPVRELFICAASTDGSAVMTADGNWCEITGKTKIGNGGEMICRDLREFDAAHPFITHIALTPCELPQITCDPVDWQGPVITSGDLKVQLERTPGGLALAAIHDQKNGALFNSGIAEPLFKLLLRRLDVGKDMMLTSEIGWNMVYEQETKNGPVYRFERDEVTLILEAVLIPELSRLEWEIDVRIHDANFSAVRLDPPAARMNAADDTRLFISAGSGSIIPITARTEKHLMSPYPAMGRCMEYMALWSQDRQRGIYCGFHDPEACYKLQLADCHDGICKLEAMIPARGIDEPRNSYHMDGQVVWQLFDGDWYDATVIFRDWVHKFANWFTGIPAAQREDVPEWLLKMPAWFLQHVSEDWTWVEKLFEAGDDLGEVPVGAHIYMWHEIPFDTNYPHYKPAKEVFKQHLPVVQAHGIKAMPYINGRLWDTHDRYDYDYQFSSVAKAGATKGRNGEVVTEHYVSTNSKGEYRELAVMCPSSAIWQEKQMEINSWILNDLGADAVYLDQIAAAAPVNCMDKTHAHRCGGGSWWYEHYNNLMDHLNRFRTPEQCYTTEANGEVYVGHIGGMLVWNWTENYQVPAFPVVYAGFQPMFGRNYNAFDKEDTWAFRIMTAQSLCFGDQIGWLAPDTYLNHPYRDFFRQLVQLRWEYNEYFYAGSCLRPPKLVGNIGRADSPKLDSEDVLSAMWKKNSDGSRIVVLVNMAEEQRTVTVYPDDAEPFEITLEPTSAIIENIS